MINKTLKKIQHFKVKKIILKINYLIFWWYYKKCGEHFRQYTFFRSIKLLIENYYHLKMMYDGRLQSIQDLGKENTKLRNNLSNMKIQLIANDTQIKFGRDILGMPWISPTEN